MKYKKFVTIGHLDHGKSSLVGRLLWDMGRISEDTKRHLLELGSSEGRQYAFILDQKREERGRGITIDVAHNKLLLDGYSLAFADVPGHETLLERAYQGIAESDAAITVIAADEGITEQTKRHIAYCKTCGIEDFIVCVNKMDKVGYQENAFVKIQEQIQPLLAPTTARSILPVCALAGENICEKSKRMSWFSGKNFLEALKDLARPGSLNDLANLSKDVIKRAVDCFAKPVMLWAGGKDSTVALSLAREVFGGKIPFPVLFIDTTWKFTETYDFIFRWSKTWDLDLLVVRNQEALEKGVNPWSVTHFEYCHELKTKPLKKAITDYGFDCVFTAIRWDEHGIRGKEQYFSPRTDPPHTRAHPVLHWSEREIWEYIHAQNIPHNPLYDKEEHKGLVYRSIGCWPFTKPVRPDHPEERSGRQVDKERLMEELRSLGYM